MNLVTPRSAVRLLVARNAVTVFARLIGVGTLCLILDPGARSATIVWQGGASTNWGTATNWNLGSGPVPGASDIASFFLSPTGSPAAGNTTVDLGGGWQSVQGLRFSPPDANGSYTLQHGALMLGSSGVVNDGGANQSLALNGIALTASQSFSNSDQFYSFTIGGDYLSLGGYYTLTLTGAGTTGAISAPITGYGNITKTGSGTWTLSGTNTFTGNVTVSQGTLALANRLAIQNATGIVLNGGTLQSAATDGSVSISQPFSVGTGGGTLDNSAGGLYVTNSDSMGFNGQSGARELTLTGTGTGSLFAVVGDSGGATSLTKTGTGSWYLAGANTFTGTTTVSEGTLFVQNSLALQNSLVSLSGGSVGFGASNATVGGLYGTGNLTLPYYTLTVGNNNVSGTYGGVLSGNNSNLIKTGTGTQKLSGANTYTGSTTVSQGTLQIGANAPSGSAGALGNATSAVIVNNANTGANDTALLVGTSGVTVGRAVTVANAGTGVTTLGANLTSGTAAFTGAITLNKSAVLESDGTANVTVSGVVSGAGGITKTGTGTVRLSANNTYSGPILITQGTLEVEDVAGYSSFPTSLGTSSTDASNLVLDGGTLKFNHLGTSGGSGLTYRLFSIGTGGGTLEGEGRFSFTFYSTGSVGFNGQSGARTLTLTGSVGGNLYPVLGDFGGPTSLTKTGTGTWLLYGANTFTGTTTVAGGTLWLGNSSALQNSTVSMSGGSVTFNTGSATFGGLSGTGNLALPSSSLTIGHGDASSSYSGVVSGLGGITKTGTGMLTLSGTNTYTGNTTVSQGTLLATNSQALGWTSSAITLNDANTGANDTSLLLGASGLLLSRDITVANSGTGATTLGGNFATGYAQFGGAVSLAKSVNLQSDGSANITFGGVLSGAGGITKTGAGSVTLGNANTFTGTTTVNAGTLAISGDSSLGAPPGTFTAAQLTLDGGTLNTSATFALNGTRGITLGTSGGTFQVDSNTTLGIGSVSGSGGLTKIGGGTLSLMVGNSFTGPVLIDNGVVGVPSVGDGGATSILGASSNAATNLILNGGTLKFTGSGAASTDRLFSVGTNGGTLDASGSTTLTFTNVDPLGFNSQSGARTLMLTGSGNGYLVPRIGDAGGATALTKSGAGTWTLAGANTFTGTTTVTDGTLQLANASALQYSTVTMSGGSLAFASGLTSATLGGLSGSGNFAAGSAPLSLTVGNGDASSGYSGVLSGSASLIKTGAGTLSLSGANTYYGSTTISQGTLQLGADAPLGAPGTLGSSGSAVVLNDASTGANNTALLVTANGVSVGRPIVVENSGTGTTTLGATITAGAAAFNGSIALHKAACVRADAAANITLGGTISGDGGITKTGTGTVALSASNQYYGATTVSQGILQLGHSQSLGLASSAVTLNDADTGANGTALLIATSGVSLNRAIAVANQGTGNTTLGASITSGTAAFSGPITLDKAARLDAAGTANITFSGAIGGSGGITKTGAGTDTLAGSNNYVGGTTLNEGTLKIGSDANLGSAGLTFDGGTLQLTNSMTFSRSVAVSSGGGAFNASGVGLSLYSNLTGSGALTLDGTSGSVYLYGNDAGFTGPVTVKGNVQLVSSNALSGANAVSLGSDGNLGLGSNRSLGALTFTAPASITGSSYTLTLGGNISVADGASGSIYPLVQLGASRTFAVGTGADLALRANIAFGSGYGITKTGAGTLELIDGSNLFSGPLVIDGGTVTATRVTSGGAASSIGMSSNAATNLVLDNGTLKYAGPYSGTTDRLFSLGTGGGTLEASNPSDSLNFYNSGAIGFNGQAGARVLTLTGTGTGMLGVAIGDSGGATSLAKTGAGTWLVSGNNTYGGTTTVSAGTLVANSNSAFGTGAVNVAGGALDVGGRTLGNAFTVSGGALRGTGTIGALTVSNGGTLSPGNSPGTLYAGNTTWAGGGSFLWDINAVPSGVHANGAAGADPGWDLLSISGALAITATSESKFTLSLSSLSLLNAAGTVADFDSASSYSFTFVTTTGGITGFNANEFAINASAFSNPFNGTWSIGQSGNNLTLDYAGAAIPEPSTYAMLIGAGALVFTVLSRRHSRHSAAAPSVPGPRHQP